MKLQKNTSLALYSVLEFASDPTRHISAAEIAAKYDVSPHHLAKVLSELARGGVVESVRGVGGGYRFAGNARRLTLLDVIEMFEELSSPGAGRHDGGERTPVGRALGVVLAETAKAAESVIEAFRGLDANILVQEFIKEAEGSDLRCFVVGERVVAAMKRVAPEGEFRANLHRGGSSEKVKLTPEERAIAVKAAREMALRVAGVDLLRSKHGPVVVEVNSSPGLKGIEEISEVDVAGKIIEYLERHAKRPKKVNA